eukprot:5744233-Amphidinium_carterae.1
MLHTHTHRETRPECEVSKAHTLSCKVQLSEVKGVSSCGCAQHPGQCNSNSICASSPSHLSETQHNRAILNLKPP